MACNFILVEAPNLDQDFIANLHDIVILIKPEPLVPRHMSSVWVLKWGGMSGYDIGNMFGSTFMRNLNSFPTTG